jgi:hypothetical protein
MTVIAPAWGRMTGNLAGRAVVWQVNICVSQLCFWSNFLKWKIFSEIFAGCMGIPEAWLSDKDKFTVHYYSERKLIFLCHTEHFMGIWTCKFTLQLLGLTKWSYDQPHVFRRFLVWMSTRKPVVLTEVLWFSSIPPKKYRYWTLK